MSENQTNQKFTDLPLSKETLAFLNENGFDEMTEIQSKSILPILSGVDVLASAKTGSGKTLSFLIPIVEHLKMLDFKDKHGTGALIIAPTRELAIQIFNVCSKLIKYHNLSVTIVIGGINKKIEDENLRKGCNIVIGTPGRLMDHLKNTAKFKISNLKILVLDETDRILDVGFEDELKNILKLLPENRQTLMFSATQTSKLEDISRLSLKNKPLRISANPSNHDDLICDNLNQFYILATESKRLAVLYSILKRFKNEKVMVFFSTCNSVNFHSQLFNFIGFKIISLHGKMNQIKRSNSFKNFEKEKTSILFCTDVAARGLDFSNVSTVIQYDVPVDVKEYIHRVGRTARAGKNGNAILFLIPTEEKYIKFLETKNMILNEYCIERIKKITEKILKIVENNYFFKKNAILAFKSFLSSYSSLSLKEYFDVRKIDIEEFCKSFGLSSMPAIQFSANFNKKTQKRL
ncbi:ATP-dependent RNA helicase [Hamiltosporidium tvaerminnensis]|nr:ATP-dependent RNA helicase [Hamiltosporidium tvaerminnensis]